VNISSKCEVSTSFHSGLTGLGWTDGWMEPMPYNNCNCDATLHYTHIIITKLALHCKNSIFTHISVYYDWM